MITELIALFIAMVLIMIAAMLITNYLIDRKNEKARKKLSNRMFTAIRHDKNET